MLKHTKIFSLLFLLMAVFTNSCGNDDSLKKSQTVGTGEPCPQFQVTDMDGHTHVMPDNNMPSIIFFFHTGCEDCNKQFPIIQQLYDDYGGKCHFIGISRGQLENEVRPFLKRNGYTFPVSADGTHTVYNLFARQIVPRVYIVGSGTIQMATTDRKPLTYTTGSRLLDFYLQPGINTNLQMQQSWKKRL